MKKKNGSSTQKASSTALAGSGKFRRLAIELGGVVECANDALWNCMELSHGQSVEFNEAKLQSAIADIRYRVEAVNRIFPNHVLCETQNSDKPKNK